jgi:hypothetical protein
MVVAKPGVDHAPVSPTAQISRTSYMYPVPEVNPVIDADVPVPLTDVHVEVAVIGSIV